MADGVGVIGHVVRVDKGWDGMSPKKFEEKLKRQARKKGLSKEADRCLCIRNNE